MPGSTVVINGSSELTFYVGDSKMELLLALLKEIGHKEQVEHPMQIESVMDLIYIPADEAKPVEQSPPESAVDARKRTLERLCPIGAIGSPIPTPSPEQSALHMLMHEVGEIRDFVMALRKAGIFLHDRYLKK